MTRPPLTLVATLTLVGFLLVVAGTATDEAKRSSEPRRQVLINQILQQRSDVDDLDRAVAELRIQVEQTLLEQGQLSERELDDQRRQDELALLAGTTALRGPGTVVTLADAPRPATDSSTRFDVTRIQDDDLQLMVNALFASGAEAIAINDNRVVAVTPIRAAGGTIVVNYRPVSSPYRINAIGVDAKAFGRTDIAGHFRDWEKKFNLGFAIEGNKAVNVPAYRGRVGIDIAEASPPAEARG